MTTKKSSVRLGLYVTDKRDGDYYHIYARPVTLGPNDFELSALDRGLDVTQPSHDAIRNPNDELLHGLYLRDLDISCQGDKQSRADGDHRHLYGFYVRYRDVFAVDLRDAERMAKTLKTIQRRMDKLSEKFGSPTSFAQFVARVAAAIKATTIVLPDTSQPWRGHSYSENKHRLVSIADGCYTIDRMEQDFVEPPKEVAHS